MPRRSASSFQSIPGRRAVPTTPPIITGRTTSRRFKKRSRATPRKASASRSPWPPARAAARRSVLVSRHRRARLAPTGLPRTSSTSFCRRSWLRSERPTSRRYRPSRVERVGQCRQRPSVRVRERQRVGPVHGHAVRGRPSSRRLRDVGSVQSECRDHRRGGHHRPGSGYRFKATDETAPGFQKSTRPPRTASPDLLPSCSRPLRVTVAHAIDPRSLRD